VQKANLARIRDNQRRSRARRKEYLQELEAKYRACEQLGVEASAEMQAAARRVLDENKKLRTLLKSKGMTDEEIESFMESEEIISHGGSPPSEHLTMLVNTRKPCCPGSECGPDTAFSSPGAASSPQQQQEQKRRQQQHQQLLQPLSGTQPSLHLASMSMNSVSSAPIAKTSPATGSAPVIYTQSAYHQLTSQSNGLSQQQTITAYPYNYPTPESHWQPYEMQIHPQSAVPNYGTTSCVDAANIIRTMRSDLGPELESELGCRQPETVCKVENSVVFDVLDKYTAQNTGNWK
jgi:hypothetical protein